MSGEGMIRAAPAGLHPSDLLPLDQRALNAAVDAYDEARVAYWQRHGVGTPPMSQLNKSSIAPLIAAAVSAYLEAEE